jgi:hypothetical protein
MPVKLRVSKMRYAQITPEAIRLFRRGLELQKIGANEINYDGEENTPAQEEYMAIWKRLHWTLLGLVGDCGPLDIAAGEEDDVVTDDGSGTYSASIPRARELHALLKRKGRSP